MAGLIGTWETALGNMFGQAFGSSAIVGIVCLIFFILLIAFLRVGMDVAAVIMVMLIFVLAQAGLLGDMSMGVWAVLLLIVGTLVGLAILRITREA